MCSNEYSLPYVTDGAIVATTFKTDGYIWNPVDTARVSAFMEVVRTFR